MATYTEPKYKPCTGSYHNAHGPLYYQFWNCQDDEFGQCPPTYAQAVFPGPICDELAPGCAACTGTSPGDAWTLIQPPDAGCIATALYPDGIIPCGDWVEGLERQNPAECGGGGVAIHPDFILSDADTGAPADPSAIWAQCGQLGVGDAFNGWVLDPAHPECYCCGGTPFRCDAFCTDFPEPVCTGEWDSSGFDNTCNSFCPFCAGFTTFDDATGLCKSGLDDGNCPPGTHWDPVCHECVSDVPPRRCWVWRDCRWNPPGRCDYPLIFDPISCSCFCPPRACPPNSFPDPVACACNPCPFGECWCATERRCVTCEDPPCKAARNCVWDTILCDWNCLPMPPGSSGCAVGEHYDLNSCTCVPDCPAGQCWCNGTSSCMACTPPDCAAELKCLWDVDLCDFACQPPPCVAPATWTGPPLCRCVGGEKGPWNLFTAYHNYHAASDDKGILYERSNSVIPPFAAAVQWTADPAHSQARMIRDWRHRTLLLYTDNSSGTPRVVERVSDDDGNTRSHPRTIFVGAKHPMPAGPQPFSGCTVYAAYDDATGTIIATRRYPGDTADSAPFTFLDDAGSPLAVDDASFGLSPAWDGPGRWALHVLQGGARHHLESTDDCESFLDVT